MTESAGAQTLFPEAQGTALLDSLVRYYKPAFVLGYDGARDKMYALIDNHSDSITCIYTGYQVYVPYNSPTPRNYTNAASPIMNAEHCWPTSKGAEGNAKSDLHHLYPTNGDANAARGNLPFDRIPDQLTDRWWRGVSYTTTIPVLQKGSYSREQSGIRFEPRDGYKGDVARSIFYFYTIYKAEADAADAGFFPIQKDVLMSWHKEDPVDPRELGRTNMIAGYQDDKPNPFVIDSTLVRRGYFSVSALPQPDFTAQTADDYELQQNYPNPFNQSTRIELFMVHTSQVRLEIYDVRGARIDRLFDGNMTSGGHTFYWTAPREISSGVYYCRLYLVHPFQMIRTKKMLLVK